MTANKDLVGAVCAYAQKRDMLPSSGIILCAVSGGADSMCLLHILCALGGKLGFSVAAAHFNHCLRGASSDGDEAFVRDWCQRQNIPFYTARGDVAAHARANGQSIEEAARALRYGFLEETADRIGASRIAVAHNADDNAETVLLNLSRGTSVGLAAIAPVRGRIIRPLLETPREQIEKYLAENGVAHVEDETNAQEIAARNRVRLHAMPALRSVNGRAVENIVRAAQIAQREGEFLDELAAVRMDVQKTPDGAFCVLRSALRDAPEVLRPRMVRLLFAQLGAGMRDFSAVHIGDVVCLALSNRASGQLSLPGAAEAVITRAHLVLRRRTVSDAAAALESGKTVRWNGYCVTCKYVFPLFEKKKDAIYISCDTIDAVPSLAPWRHDARMELADARGARSLKRLFAENGVAPAQRERTPNIYLGDTLAAVYGIGVAKAFLPQEGGGAWEIEIFDESQGKTGGENYEKK